MYFYQSGFRKQLIKALLRLLLESYFDLVMCTFINLHSFFVYPEFGQTFFGTVDDSICSTTTIAYTFIIVTFPYYGFKMIEAYQGNFDRGGIFAEILMEGVRKDEYYASMYTFNFMARRFLTAGILIFGNDYAFSQVTLLMLFSTINFIYIVSTRPLDTAKENVIELFNEFSILLCGHLFSVFL